MADGLCRNAIYQLIQSINQLGCLFLMASSWPCQISNDSFAICYSLWDCHDFDMTLQWYRYRHWNCSEMGLELLLKWLEQPIEQRCNSLDWNCSETALGWVNPNTNRPTSFEIRNIRPIEYQICWILQLNGEARAEFIASWKSRSWGQSSVSFSALFLFLSFLAFSRHFFVAAAAADVEDSNGTGPQKKTNAFDKWRHWAIVWQLNWNCTGGSTGASEQRVELLGNGTGMKEPGAIRAARQKEMVSARDALVIQWWIIG